MTMLTVAGGRRPAVPSSGHAVSPSGSTVASRKHEFTSRKHEFTSRNYNVASLELDNTTAQLDTTTVEFIADSKFSLLAHKSTSNSRNAVKDHGETRNCYVASNLLSLIPIRAIVRANKMSIRAYSTDSDGDPVMTHLDKHGKARMVDVGDKPVTSRAAEAQCCLRVGGRLLRLLRDARLPKGDALTVAQVAGVVGAKKTADLIPMCHPLPLDCVRIKIELPKAECEDGGDIRVHCEVKVTSKTGAEMEALTGAAVAALALYDMCKSVDKYMRITDLKVIRKSGGRSGDWPKENVPEDVKVRDYNKTPIKPKETYAPTNMMYF